MNICKHEAPQVVLPVIMRALRSKPENLANDHNDQNVKKKVSTDRVRKYCEKLKNDPGNEQNLRLCKRKKGENKALQFKA